MFIKFYSRLTTVFRNKDYLPHLVTARVVSPDNIHHLSSLSNRDRALRLLEYILYSIEGGEIGCFYRMLEVMQEHGNLHAQNVAEEINKAIVSGVDSTGMHMCTCMYVCMCIPYCLELWLVLSKRLVLFSDWGTVRCNIK